MPNEIMTYDERVAGIDTMMRGYEEKLVEACVGGIIPLDLISSLSKAIKADTKDNIIKCSDDSIFAAVMTCAKIGLDPTGEHNSAWLIPFKKELTVMIGYGGYIDLILRGGDYHKIDTEVVYEGEHFEFHRGTRDEIIHTLDMEIRNHQNISVDKIVAAYAIASHKNGSKQWVVLGQKDIEAARKASRAPGGGPWQARPAEMVKKSSVRALAKWMVLDKLGKLATNISDRGDGYDFEETRTRPVENTASDALRARINNADKPDHGKGDTLNPLPEECDPETGEIIPDHIGVKK